MDKREPAEAGSPNPQAEDATKIPDQADEVEDLPAFKGMLQGKIRPLPREPETTYYRHKDPGVVA